MSINQAHELCEKADQLEQQNQLKQAIETLTKACEIYK